MTLDLAVLAGLLLFGLLGAITGAIRQLAHLAGLVVGFAFARPVGLGAAAFFQPRVTTSPLLLQLACTFAAFFLLYGTASLIAGAVFKAVIPEGEKGEANRIVGFVLGAAKAAALAFVLLSGLLMLDRPLKALWRDWPRHRDQSKALTFARKHSVFGISEELERFRRWAEVRSKPAAAPKPAEAPAGAAAAALPKLPAGTHPKLEALLADPAVRRAAESRDYAALLANAKVAEALRDPEVMKQLLDFAKATPGE